jgi:putative ABC transport system ATP-binding protein
MRTDDSTDIEVPADAAGPAGTPDGVPAEARDNAAEMAEGAPLAARLRGIRKTFAAELAPVRALRGIDLDVRYGEFVAVMGPSGCGKSTMLNLVAGLDVADEGTVEVAGEQVSGRDEDWLARFRRHHVGIVFQFFNLIDGVSAMDNLVLPAVIGGARRRAAESRARDLLDLLGLGDRAEQVPAVLSGGQRQRLAVARALVNSPTLLLADEPTGALDSEGGLEVLELFRRLHGDGQTIIMVTHSADVAAGATRVVQLRDGRVVADTAPPRDLPAPAGLPAPRDPGAVPASGGSPAPGGSPASGGPPASGGSPAPGSLPAPRAGDGG